MKKEELAAELNKIRRFNLEHCYGGGSMDEDAYGDYIRFDDLVEAMKQFGVSHSEYNEYGDDAEVTVPRGFRPAIETQSSPQDGWYFYRDTPDRVWLATEIRSGKAWARWISNGGPMDLLYLTGQWHGPLPADNQDIKLAQMDVLWRLDPVPGETIGHYEPMFTVLSPR